MIAFENVSNVSSTLEATHKKIFDISNSCSTKKCQLQNSVNTKMDALIESTELSKNRLALLESHNKTKGKEVENEYNFLKQVGDICKRSCHYYLETNINFHETCENFNILFKIFSESLSCLEEKNKIADANKEILKKIEEKETICMMEKKEVNDKHKKQLEELEKSLHFMNNESKNITNKIKEIDYQINQHKEAFESFFILTNLNHEKNAILEKSLNSLKQEQEDIINSIKQTEQKKTECNQDLIDQKEQLKTQREELVQLGQELKAESERLVMRKNEIISNISILESQTKFLENQIKSQEYYLNVITSGYEGNMKRKEELEENIRNVQSIIDNIHKKMDSAEIEHRGVRDEHDEIIKNLERLEKDLEEKKEELKVIQELESVSNMKVLTEKKNIDEQMLTNLTKEKNSIEEKIANYKEEIKNLLIDEKKKVDLLKDVSEDYKDNKSLLKNLEKVLEEYKIGIKEEQEKQWTNERAIKKIQIKMKELKEKVEEEKQKDEEMSVILNARNEEVANLKKKATEMEKGLGTIKKEKMQLETKYIVQSEEVKKIENKLSEMIKKVETSVNQLHKEFEEKTKNVYDGKTKKIGLESAEKKQMEDENATYFDNLKKEYELKKKEFKEEFTKQSEEESKQIDEELKKKDELIAYYKELLSKMKTKDGSGNVELLKSTISGKKICNTQNPIPKKNEMIKLYHKRNSGNKSGNVINNSANAFTNNSNTDTNGNGNGKGNGNGLGNNGNNNNNNQKAIHLNNLNRFKLYNMSESYKFGYFDVTSPDIIRKNMKMQNRSIKSPHITRLLEKIKNRKDCQTKGGAKKPALFQSGKNNKNFHKMKPVKNPATFDLFQHF